MSDATLEPLNDRTRLAQEKARVLREALPWITKWTGRTVVVKYGGGALGASDDDLAAAFAADVALLASVGLQVVVVHGGGPQITELSARLGLEATFVDGRRVTDDATLDVVRMVLRGQVNPALVNLIEAQGARAVGVSGIDGELLMAVPARGGELGHVGQITEVDTTLLTSLLEKGLVPVVATLARNAHGGDLNVNADTAAGEIAVALGADKLIYLSNVSGLYQDFGTDGEELLSVVTKTKLRTLLESQTLHTGMVPKVESVVSALDGGVRQAHLLDGRVEHALLLEIFTDEGIGTMVVPDTPAGEA